MFFQSLFPDIVDKRETEFIPYLSLGQYDSNIVEEFAHKYATEWEQNGITVAWRADVVYLYSRCDFTDPPGACVREKVFFNGILRHNSCRI